jgi:hypothetical protein
MSQGRNVEQRLVDRQSRRGSHNALSNDHVPPDTTVLERIREGRGTRIRVSEDLPAALRDAPLQEGRIESYGDMRKALLE